MEKKLSREFYARNADVVARDILGKVLIRKFPDGTRKEGVITETEAYLGVKDLACHAAGGRRTKRTQVMYGNAGFAYIYFVYGMHWLLNVVCSAINDPQAVLIRGLDVAPGPASLTKALEIDGSLNCADMVEKGELWIEDRGVKVKGDYIKTTPRVGIDYAKEWKDKPLRFFFENSVKKKGRNP
jgi:DNA-3-methyladenine glycosylase